MPKLHILAVPIAIAMLSISYLPAHSFVSALILADRYVKNESKIALNTPGHAAWCSRKHPGYRKQWNNYKRPNGRVRHCASPYYTPPWMKWGRK